MEKKGEGVSRFSFKGIRLTVPKNLVGNPSAFQNVLGIEKC